MPNDSTGVQRPALVHPNPTPSSRSGGGGGDDSRLRALEEGMVRLDERVLAIKEHMAEKNDITTLKVWILGGVLGAIAVGAGIAATVVKAFF